MDIDLMMALAGLFVGFIVGLTGMGGGALMTPVLVIFFSVNPLTAVSSDLVVSLVMKPIGGAVHARRGTVNVPLVSWLAVGSVPAAFGGVLLLRTIGGDDADLQSFVKTALGWALIIAAAGIVLKSLQTIRTKARAQEYTPPPVVVRPIPTVLVGIVGGVVVGMTSVGSGSLIIVALLFLYPGLKAGEIVGTDLVQAVPLVGAAAIGHILFGDFQFDVASSVLLGAIPGVYFGARVSAHASQSVIRRALVIVLTASALKLLGVGNGALLGWLATALVIGTLLWALVRHTQGLTRRPEPLTPAAAAREAFGALTGRRRRRDPERTAPADDATKV
ncbi:MAG TPA: sulfite exporter TauE/SafE family protein [Sporichthya sp.]|nr:sulfite exporter TauE/SafE family protein [Sporichthya sp.]